VGEFEELSAEGSEGFSIRQTIRAAHESTTDADAKIARKDTGKDAKLSYNGNLLVDNRHG
jgi:hypothetical protein